MNISATIASAGATREDTPDVEFLGVSKLYGEVRAVDGVDMRLKRGAFVSLLGPSGCGKTTCLRMMAGFEQPTTGQVLIRGEDMTHVPAYRRPVNMVFQHYALFPHLNVEANVSYGLRQRSPAPPANEIKRAVGDALAMVRLAGYERRRTWELSGGQQQRVALARALINRPAVLLLDEPLAALDRKLRREMQIELQNLQRNIGITFLLVTHDQEEALSMSDEVCIMRDGKIVQAGSPRELYDEPVDRYVADFVGRSNFFAGRAGSGANGTIAVTLSNGFACSGRAPATAAPPRPGETVVLSIRPEQMVMAEKAADLPGDASSRLDVVLRNRIFLGEHIEYLVEHATLGEFLVLIPRQADQGDRYATGDTVSVGWRPKAALVLKGAAAQV